MHPTQHTKSDGAASPETAQAGFSKTSCLRVSPNKMTTEQCGDCQLAFVDWPLPLPWLCLGRCLSLCLGRCCLGPGPLRTSYRIPPSQNWLLVMLPTPAIVTRGGGGQPVENVVQIHGSTRRRGVPHQASNRQKRNCGQTTGDSKNSKR